MTLLHESLYGSLEYGVDKIVNHPPHPGSHKLVEDALKDLRDLYVNALLSPTNYLHLKRKLEESHHMPEPVIHEFPDPDSPRAA